jgi:catechol 2,3-dioxygenase-like lactoylglutathione lyase family enzyme
MKGIEHPGIYVSDLEKSIEFYQKLGFQTLRKTTRPHAMMYLGNDILEIMPRLEEVEKEGFSPPFPYHIAFYTDDIEEDLANLHEQGIETGEVFWVTGSALENTREGIVEYADPSPVDPKLFGCMMPSNKWKVVRFKDPDGINLEIWQRL